MHNDESRQSNMRRRVLASIGAGLLGTMSVGAATQTAFAAGAKNAPRLETVATFDDDFRLVGIGVSKEGRVFATAPASAKRSRYSMVEVDTKTGALTPFPDERWNVFKPDEDGSHQWISVQALWVDEQDHLWALDSSLTSVDQTRQPPKLIEFDLATKKIVRRFDYGSVVTPKDSLNDIRVDLKHGYVYLSNAANQGGVAVTNLATGESRLVLAGDKSSVSDPQQHLMFRDQIARKGDGSVLVLQTDGIALSPDREWLYYRPLTDHHYWRVPTKALIDTSLSADALSKKVQFLGDGALTGGLIMSPAGVLYGGDLENRTVVGFDVVEKHGKPGLVQKTLVGKHPQLSWADGFAIQNGYLYIADSHLHELNNFSNPYPREGKFAIFRVRLPKQPAHGLAG
ncbi:MULTISPECIES: L-dopachrome tautomerase-related protein [unclassified Caballeronia]|uniref:L-dopachrome tautomerase-related protein n=1 Tax=unclassified Caballeronia TaxID=2646786 RepID=UPI00285A8F2C|nr:MULTISPECIES: L-dopachrome tautomerase-related protein [unclassified Caballeronia]MDR5773939.1 L-dopachrome tautomerase-related protein [Caballeronia sp. LZ002]MDR5849374.1 L-dopachrome tautomerase-related protein [Caballeronia sp. LZ003]